MFLKHHHYIYGTKSKTKTRAYKKIHITKIPLSKAMDAASLAFSVAQTLLSALQLPELKEIISICGYESRLEELKGTVTRINAVLQDAEAQEELSRQHLDFVGKLKDAVYDADDLLDEFITRKQQQLIRDSSQGQVSRLVSPFKKLSLACKMSREIKKIREKLDGIASDASMFGFKRDYIQPIRREREETCSYVHVETVFGREVDKREIVDMLLDANAEGFVPVLSIVGMGGLGKTTLAQLVFNDRRIEIEFPMRLWVCVSDQYPNQWNVKSILASILRATNDKDVDECRISMEEVVQKLREKLERSKYLLVLDDVWIEDRGKWLHLETCLLGLARRGSRIVVTTRSKNTAIAVGSTVTYELEGLSKDDSWRLFEAIVGRGQPIPHDLVDIGKDILTRCANVPLAIKVIGSLLYDQDKSKWESFQRRTLSEIRKEENDVMPILMFSYHNLSPPLKSCFSYCAVFPKDFVIRKDMLIGLWMAQGYLEPSYGDQSMEDVGEEYFQILLQRCFFQDIEKDANDEILSCKMHDLMHDVAQKVAGKEIAVADSTTSGLDQQVQIRHIYFERNPSDCADRFISSKAQIRTYLQGNDSRQFQFPMSMMLIKWMNLRALHLRSTKLESLPNDIGKLVHLRYLDISDSGLEILPKSITKLVNLQTLHLNALYKLKELPRDLNRLAKLRVLGIADCASLKYMPDGMNRMTCLNTLPMFVVAKRDSSIKQHGIDELEDLRALRNLKGSLEIRIDRKYAYKEVISGGGGYISNKEYLKGIEIQWFEGDREEGVDSAEELLEGLQPHRNLKGFTVKNYPGAKIPRWAMESSLTTSLPNLVDIVISGCHGLQSLPWLGELQSLKSLRVSSLDSLEYMEDKRISGSDSSSSSREAAGVLLQSSSFFPSLEFLELHWCPKLKGWWRGLSTSGLVMEDDDMMGGESSIITVGGHRLPSFPRLFALEIYYCPNLAVIPLCPMVETLKLWGFNERLQIMIKKEEERRGERGSNDSGNSIHDPKMRVLETDNARHLESLPVVALQCLAQLKILGGLMVESLSEIEEVFRSCSSSLQYLEISECEKLRSVSGGLKHLTALGSLELINLRELRFDETEGEEEGEEEDRTGMPWRRLAQCLRYLELEGLPKVDDLPKGMCYLTALQSLTIRNLQLKDLPEWIGCLSSLKYLEICNCKYLESLPEALQKLTSLQQFQLYNCNEIIKRRCQRPDGEDWPKIQHIAHTCFDRY